MTTYKIETITYRDNNNALTRGKAIWIDGIRVWIKCHSRIWRNKEWKKGEILMTNCEGVMSIKGIDYRVSERSIKPLVIEAGETVWSSDHETFNARKSFVA